MGGMCEQYGARVIIRLKNEALNQITHNSEKLRHRMHLYCSTIVCQWYQIIPHRPQHIHFTDYNRTVTLNTGDSD